MHTSCQIVNAYLQNKIGSGFDIACALYGSQLYRRFTNTSQLEQVVEAVKSGGEANLLAAFEAGFDYTLQPLNLPAGLRMLMVDVNSGSDTRVLTKQVLLWEKEHRAEELKDVMFSGYEF